MWRRLALISFLLLVLLVLFVWCWDGLQSLGHAHGSNLSKDHIIQLGIQQEHLSIMIEALESIQVLKKRDQEQE